MSRRKGGTLSSRYRSNGYVLNKSSNLKPPPDLPYPDIIEWSKPLPPEQWAKRSPELEHAIAKREAELAALAVQETA